MPYYSSLSRESSSVPIPILASLERFPSQSPMGGSPPSPSALQALAPRSLSSDSVESGPMRPQGQGQGPMRGPGMHSPSFSNRAPEVPVDTRRGYLQHSHEYAGSGSFHSNTYKDHRDVHMPMAPVLYEYGHQYGSSPVEGMGYMAALPPPLMRSSTPFGPPSLALDTMPTWPSPMYSHGHHMQIYGYSSSPPMGNVPYSGGSPMQMARRSTHPLDVGGRAGSPGNHSTGRWAPRGPTNSF